MSANVVMLMERIAVALERLADAMTPPAVEADVPCLHPAESRTDMSTMGHPAWLCDPALGGCGFSVGMEQ